MTPSGEVTALLSELHTGNREVTTQLMPLIYAQLRRIAASQCARERRGHTLQPSDLIQETYLRLMKPGAGPSEDRRHFFGVASHAMREILVDYSRRHHAKKRGGSAARVELDQAIPCATNNLSGILDLDRALKRLGRLSHRQAKIVELRFFAGLTINEAASVLGVGVTVAKDEWALAKAWLQRELGKAS